MENRSYDIIIVGGGPAGLACGQYGARAGRKTLVIEEMACGGQTMIIDEIENYPGLGRISGYEIGAKFEEQAQSFGCEFDFATVNSIAKNGNLFDIDTTNGVYQAPAVVIATGAKHRNLEIPGEKELTGHGVSYCATCDGPFYRKKKILVCGGGDSACQEALYLAKLTDDITICHRRDRFRAQASIVQALKDTGKVKFKMSTEPVSINGENSKVTSVTFRNKETGELYTEAFDGVFIFIGNIPQTQLVPSCEKDEAGFIRTDRTMMTSIDGLFAVGDVRDTPFRQVVTAAADGAVAAHYASEYIDAINGMKY